MYVRAGHAAMEDVADDGDLAAVKLAAAVANRQRVEKPLRGMFVSAIACMMRVRVEFSKKLRAIVLPRRVANFFNG